MIVASLSESDDEEEEEKEEEEEFRFWYLALCLRVGGAGGSPQVLWPVDLRRSLRCARMTTLCT